MKTKNIISTFFLALLLSFGATPVQANTGIPIVDIIKAAVKKVIKAVDLKIQRLQNKTIWLQNAQKVLENTLSKLKLKEISAWNKKHKEQYKAFFQELWKIKKFISDYQRVKDILKKQDQLMSEYQIAWNMLRQDENFSQAELDAMSNVYEEILDASLENLDHLLDVVTAFTTQMSDAERLRIIHETDDRVQRNLNELRVFNWRNFMISRQRSGQTNNIEILQNLYDAP